MISFRFHVVSITAVFLAIAIGVVIGSTYVDGAVVEGLRNRIATVSDTLDERKAANDRLKHDLAAASAYVDASADYAVSDRLLDVAVLLVATRGVDDSAVEEVARLARRAGAVLPGIVWLEAGVVLDADDRAALGALVDMDTDSDAEDLWAAAWSAVAEEVAGTGPAAPASTASTTTTSGAPPVAPVAVLASLQASGLITLDPLDDTSVGFDDLTGSKARVLVLSGSRARDEVVPMVRIVVDGSVSSGLDTVVGDVHVQSPETPGRGQRLVDSLPADLRDVVVLVDDVDRVEGQVAVVLALHGVSVGLVGHFGYGDGADSMLPAWTPP